MAHRWPGQVRELSNVLERALLLAGDGPIGPEHLELAGDSGEAAFALPAARAAHEADCIRRALAGTGGNRRAAAVLLGISERTLRYKLAAAEGRPRPAAGRRPAGVTLQ
jgi:DNA-binding NtrC family response regulator